MIRIASVPYSLTARVAWTPSAEFTGTKVIKWETDNICATFRYVLALGSTGIYGNLHLAHADRHLSTLNSNLAHSYPTRKEV